MGEKTRLVETPKGVLMNPELGGDALPLAYDERAAVERDDEERQQHPTSQHHVPERAQTERSDPCHCGTSVNLAAFVYPNIHHEDILANPGTEYDNGGGHQQDCVHSPRKGERHAVHIEVLVDSVSVIEPTPLDPAPRY